MTQPVVNSKKRASAERRSRSEQRVGMRRPKLLMSLFDSYAVWLEVHKRAPLSSKVTPTQVADVLDAVVAIERKAHTESAERRRDKTMSETLNAASEETRSRRPSPAICSALATKLLNALRLLTKECVPHPCGGFTTDDMEWRMGTAFTGEAALNAALDELQESKLIRYAGYDDDDAIGHCYSIAPNAPAHRPARTEKD